MSAAFLRAARRGLHRGPAAARGDLLGTEQLSLE